MLEDRNANGLADAIGGLTDSQLTGPLSMIDEASGRFARLSPRVAEARQAFSQARFVHQRSWNPATGRYSDETWRSAMSAAEALANELRALHRRGGDQQW
jgi:uncharacterized protein YukE